MAISKLNITIHNPNTPEDTARMLVEVFAEVVLAKVEKQLMLEQREEREKKIS